MGMFLSSIAARRSSVGRSERAQDLSSIRIHVLSPEFEHTMFFSYSNIFNYGISLWHGPSSFHFSPQYQAGLGNWTCPGGLTPRWWHSCFGPSLSLLKDQGSLFHGEESSVRRRFLQVLRWTHNSFVLTSQCYLVSSAVPPSWWKERQASSRQQNQCSLSDREALMSFDSGGCWKLSLWSQEMVFWLSLQKKLYRVMVL